MTLDAGAYWHEPSDIYAYMYQVSPIVLFNTIRYRNSVVIIRNYMTLTSLRLLDKDGNLTSFQDVIFQQCIS